MYGVYSTLVYKLFNTSVEWLKVWCLATGTFVLNTVDNVRCGFTKKSIRLNKIGCKRMDEKDEKRVLSYSDVLRKRRVSLSDSMQK